MPPTIIIPFRAADDYRLRNLLLVVKHLSCVFPGSEVLIAEQDTVSKINGIVELETCTLQLLADSGAFNKSKLINMAADNAASDVLLVCDADIIVKAADLRRTLSALAQGLEFARPFEQLIDLDNQQTVEYLDTGILPERAKKNESNSRAHLGEELCMAGGTFVIRKSVFFEVGGFDERFSGWGGEDDAFVLSLRVNRSKVVYLKGATAWHMWHPRSKRSSPFQGGDNHQLLKSLQDQASSHLALTEGVKICSVFRSNIENHSKNMKNSQPFGFGYHLIDILITSHGLCNVAKNKGN